MRRTTPKTRSECVASYLVARHVPVVSWPRITWLCFSPIFFSLHSHVARLQTTVGFILSWSRQARIRCVLGEVNLCDRNIYCIEYWNVCEDKFDRNEVAIWLLFYDLSILLLNESHTRYSHTQYYFHLISLIIYFFRLPKWSTNLGTPETTQ